MNRTTVAALAVTGAVLALLGLVFGLMPTSAPSGASCGSAFIPGEWAPGCKAALGSFRTTALVLLVPGVLVLLVANGFRMAVAQREARPVGKVAA